MASTKELLAQLLAQMSPADKADLLRQAAEATPEVSKTPVQDLLEDLADHRFNTVKLGLVLGRLFAKLEFTGEVEEEPEEPEPAAPAEPVAPAAPVVATAAEPPVNGE